MSYTAKRHNSRVRALQPIEIVGFNQTLQNRLSDRCDEFTKIYSAVRKQPKRKAVHDLRTACRRLIAATELLEGLEPPIPLDKLQKSLKDLQHSLRELRDLQVEEKRVASELPKLKRMGDGAAENFLKDLKKNEKNEKRSIKKELECFDCRFLKKQVDAIIRYLSRLEKLEPEFEKELEILALEHLRSQVRAVLEKAKQVPSRSPAPLPIHSVRIRFKHFRYAWELVHRKTDQKNERQLKKFQTLLGDIQDRQVLLSTLADFCDETLDPYAREIGREQKKLIQSYQHAFPRVAESMKKQVKIA